VVGGGAGLGAEGVGERMAWMRKAVVSVVIGVVSGLVGCAKPKPPPPPPPAAAPEETLRSLREQYKLQDPNAAVGAVAAVKPDTRMAAVGDMPLKEFRIGDPVVFVDATQAVIDTGTVAEIDDPWLIVKYEDPTGQGRRTPQVGDVAVRFSNR